MPRLAPAAADVRGYVQGQLSRAEVTPFAQVRVADETPVGCTAYYNPVARRQGGADTPACGTATAAAPRPGGRRTAAVTAGREWLALDLDDAGPLGGALDRFAARPRPRLGLVGLTPWRRPPRCPPSAGTGTSPHGLRIPRTCRP